MKEKLGSMAKRASYWLGKAACTLLQNCMNHMTHARMGASFCRHFTLVRLRINGMNAIKHFSGKSTPVCSRGRTAWPFQRGKASRSVFSPRNEEDIYDACRSFIYWIIHAPKCYVSAISVDVEATCFDWTMPFFFAKIISKMRSISADTVHSSSDYLWHSHNVFFVCRLAHGRDDMLTISKSLWPSSLSQRPVSLPVSFFLDSAYTRFALEVPSPATVPLFALAELFRFRWSVVLGG